MIRSVLVLIAAIAFGLAPFVTNGFAGFRPDQFPVPQENAPVQPAGYAFSIWGVIYLWLMIYAVAGIWRYRDARVWQATWGPMVISMGVGAVWIKVAILSVIWATILIWVMTFFAIRALLASRKGAPGWALSLPIGLYAGWLTAASCVALGLTGAGYGFGDSTIWAMIMVGVAILLGAWVQLMSGIWSFGLALGWALGGIIVQNLDGARPVLALAAMGIVLIAALLVRQLRMTD